MDKVSLKTAIKLYYIYDKPCEWHYEQGQLVSGEFCSYNKQGLEIDEYDAPFLVDVQSWLNKEHNIQVVVNDDFQGFFFSCKNLATGVEYITSHRYVSYERALARAIDYALT